MNTTEFRKEIVKIMPGYKWTVAKPCRLKTDAARGFSHITATGVQSAGFNRVSTLLIVRHEEDGTIEYEAKIAGYGTRGPWAETEKGETLARALRYLQERCSVMMATYNACVLAMMRGRGKGVPE